MLKSVKKVPKRGKRPEGRTDRAMQDEKLLDALKSFISTGQGTSNEFHFERSQEQKDRFESFKQGENYPVMTNICEFPYPIYDLTKNLRPFL